MIVAVTVVLAVGCEAGEPQSLDSAGGAFGGRNAGLGEASSADLGEVRGLGNGADRSGRLGWNVPGTVDEGPHREPGGVDENEGLALSAGSVPSGETVPVDPLAVGGSSVTDYLALPAGVSVVDDVLVASEVVLPADLSVLVSRGGIDTLVDISEITRQELYDTRAVLALGGSQLLLELGVFGFLESYVMNIPPSADYLARFEVGRAGSASFHFYTDPNVESEMVSYFERSLLSAVWFAVSELRLGDAIEGFDVLHDAFYGAMAECARESRWPRVQLFSLHEGRGYDVEPEQMHPDLDISAFEFMQLTHQCGRYAATYPGLDKAERDRLLEPQREHYVLAVLEELANEYPVIEVPERYREELEEFRGLVDEIPEFPPRPPPVILS